MEKKYKVKALNDTTYEVKTYSPSEDDEGKEILALTHTENVQLKALHNQLNTFTENVERVKAIIALVPAASKGLAKEKALEAARITEVAGNS